MRELIWSLGQDIRSGWRGLRRDRAFGIIAAGTLALGIGTSTTIYALVDRVLVRPLPYDRPDELVSLTPQHSFMRAEFDMARERLRSARSRRRTERAEPGSPAASRRMRARRSPSASASSRATA